MGWTRRNPPGGRTCKHTQDYEQYLQPLWNNLNTGNVTEVKDRPKQTEVKNETREKGGTLDQLFRKLEKGGL
jgi:hypothetical protein